MTNRLRIDSRTAIALSLLAAAACSGPPPAVSTSQSADPLFANGGFESGNLTGWTTTVY